MPFLIKRKKQLQKAHDYKRQKLQEPGNHHPEQEESVEEALGSLTMNQKMTMILSLRMKCLMMKP